MSDSAAPAERAPAPEINPNDMRALANSIPDEAFDFDDEDVQGTAAERQAAEQPAREEGEEPGDDEAARRAAEEETDAERETREADAEREERRARGEETDEERTEREDRELKAAKDAPEQSKTFRVAGVDRTADEIERGFLRQEDYTRKSQENAEIKRQVQAYAQHLRAQEGELAQVLELATEITRANLPRPPDEAMIDTDVIAYNKAQAAYTREVQKLEKLVQARSALGEQQTAQQRAASEQEQQRRKQAFDAALQNESRLMHERLPELRTADGWNTLYADVEKHGTPWGLSRQEVAGIQDHRQLLVLKDALAFRKLQSAKPAAVEQARAAPPIRPAVRQPGTRGPDSRRSAEERFHRDPTIRNAVATLPDSLFE